MSNGYKKRDGFKGEKLINVPYRIQQDHPYGQEFLNRLHVTQIGYFPSASFHYRERRKGCEDNILIYCVNGKGHYIFDKKRFEVHENQYIILPATDKYMRYWADVNDPWTIYWVHFTGDLLSTFNTFFNFNGCRGPVPINLNEPGLAIWHEIYECFAKGFKMENVFNANFCLYHLLATFLFPALYAKKQQVFENDYIQKAISIMENNLSARLTVDDISEAVGLSSSYFSTAFRKARSMPPIDYFINMKMHKACELIKAGGIKIKQISTELGYDDPYYFSRLFKRFVGLSPVQYRTAIFKSISDPELSGPDGDNGDL